MNSPADQSPRRLCAVVPAAGRGSRLGVDVPKVFVPILPDVTIWDAVRSKLFQVTDHLVLILSPEGQDYVQSNRSHFTADSFAKTKIAIQPVPLGMGDAIFGAVDFWRGYDDILVVWGDQFNLSLQTLTSCIKMHATLAKPALTLPVVRASQPYVEYVFNSSGSLTQIRQSREGDACEPNGFSDIGVFLLSGGTALIDEWQRYLETHAAGSKTGEINFLPFLVHLSSIANWPVNRYETHDPAEAIGINTPDDLAFARQLLQKTRSPL